MSITLLGVYLWLLPILLWKKKLWKKQFYIILATNTIQSCIEAAEELFRHTFGHKSMKHVNAYFYIHVYCLFCFRKKCRFSFSSSYHLQLHWSCWRAVPGHLGLWLHQRWCQYHFCMCMYDNCLFYSEKKRISLFLLQILSAAALKLLTNCSSAPWVMNAWNLISILLLYVYICL